MTEVERTSGHAFALTSGERGRAVAFDNGVLHLVGERAHPPGEPLALALDLPAGGQLDLQGKCAGSKRRADGQYDVKLRLTSLRREQRAALEELLGTGAP